MERVQREAENAIPFDAVTLDEVDETLEGIARACRFSAPSVREAPMSHNPHRFEALQRIYLKLQSREAKWFTRMILKDYGNLELKEGMVLNCLDSRLSAMVKAQDSFESAVKSLRGSKLAEGNPAQKDKNKSTNPMPRIGTKVGRTTYLKGRSIKHAVEMIHGRKMSVERKYDGEYCQVHIDLSKGDQCIQIFSKSGKDSTKDKVGLHKQISDSLRLGQADCGFSRCCILEGEMVVWSDKDNCIVGFHKIRKHVGRSGSFLGTALDSPPHHYEHLMIFYYDVMLIEDDPVLDKPHYRRRHLLEQLVTPIKGRAKLVTREEYDFRSPKAPKQLEEALAHAFVHQWEGLVLKPSHGPYFATAHRTGKDDSAWIKLKKDYIAGLGDTADFAIVGATYNSSEAARFKEKNLTWTRFHIGCLTNRDAVLHQEAKPCFAVIDSLNACIKPVDLVAVNRLGQFRAVSTTSKETQDAFDVEIQSGVCDMSVTFWQPFVFEVMGSGFDKQPNQDFYTLRFPRILKVHLDRSWKEAVDFDELQAMAEEARVFESREAATNVAAWVERLRQASRGSKGMAIPWDDSQDQHDEEPPSMIRIDSKEKLPTEQRFGNRSISGTSPSQCSTASDQSGASDHMPPSSLPLQAPGDEIKIALEQMTAKPPVTSRKRSVQLEEEGIENRVVKKVQFQSLLTNEPNIVSDSSSSAKAEPLQPITNSAARPYPTPSIKPAKSGNFSALSLVRQMASGTAGRRSTRSKNSIDLSSPGRETTVSESSTDEPSQSTQQSFASALSAPIQTELPGQIGVPASLVSRFDLPSDPDTPELTEKVTIEIPDLKQSSFILGRCVASMRHLEDILQSSAITILPFPNSESAIEFPKNRPTRDIILLVESHREEATADHLKQLVTVIRRDSRAVIAIWDWRVMEDLIRADGPHGKSNDIDVLRWHFFGRIEWLDGGQISVRWGDGRETRAASGPRLGGVGAKQAGIGF